MKFIGRHILLLLLLFCTSHIALAQQTITEKKEEADQLFEAKEWSKAEVLYSTVISNDPRNHELNFKYGACLLNGSKNKDEAIKRLRFSITNANIDARAYYYLGKAYHLNYQFSEALTQYQKFKSTASTNELKKLDVDTDIYACKNGGKLLANLTDLIVIAKTELSADKFYDLYKLDDIGGMLLITDKFQSKLDKKANHRPIIHFPVNAPKIYFSSYGDNDDNGLDIYVKNKLPGGEWSESQLIKGQVNTGKDEAFAYMHPNGEYLYFSSKGHNSMGGYDVYRSKYDKLADSFGKPENMDFAISSPDDDILFVVDSLDRVAYFSSARESSQEKLMVYKVRMERIPLQLAVLKGNFVNEIDGSQKEIAINIKNEATGRVIGTFNSNKANGDYFIMLPQSGNFVYEMMIKGSNETYVQVVNIPYQSEITPLKQEIKFFMDNGEEAIMIDNQFKDKFADPESIMAEVYQALSKLPPNADKFDIDSLDKSKANGEIFVQAGMDAFLSKSSLNQILNSEKEDLQAAIKKDEANANMAFNLANNKSVEANQKMLDLNKQLDDLIGITDPEEKQAALVAINDQKNEIQTLNDDAKKLLLLGNQIDESVKKKVITLAATNKLIADLSNVKNESLPELQGLVSNNMSYFEANIKNEPKIENVVDNALAQNRVKEKEFQSLSEEISAISRDEQSLIAKNKSLEKSLELAKKKEKIAIQEQMDNNASDIAMFSAARKSKQDKLDQLINGNVDLALGDAALLVSDDRNNRPENKSDLSASDKDKIKSNVNQNDLTESIELVEEELAEQGFSIFKIDLYASNEENSLYSLAEWNAKIDNAKIELAQARMTASPEELVQIEAEEKRLEQLRKEKEIELKPEAAAPLNTNPEVAVNDFITDYDQQAESIETIVNATDRKKAEVALKEDLAKAIRTEKALLEKELAKNSKNKDAKKRLENLNELETENQNQIDEDKEWIAEQVADEFDPSTVLSSLDPEYENKLADANAIEDDAERQSALAELDDALLERSLERIQELEVLSADDPSNQKIADELTYLEELNGKISKTEKNADIEVATVQSEVLIDDIIPAISTSLADIEEIADETERKEQENTLLLSLTNKIGEEISEIEALKSEGKTPINGEERLTNLKNAENKYLTKIEENDVWLAGGSDVAAIDNQPTDENNSVDIATDPILENDPVIDETDPTDTENGQDTDSVIAETDPTDNDPIAQESDPVIDDIDPGTELTQEDPIIDELDPTDNDPIAQETDQAGAQEISIEDIEKPTAENLIPDYGTKMSTIMQSEGSDVDKLTAENDLNEDLLVELRAKRSELEKLKADQPENTEVIDGYLEEVENLERIKSNQIQVNNNDIKNLQKDNSQRPEITMSSVMPEFDNEMDKIEVQGMSEMNELAAVNDINYKLLDAIDDKILDIQREAIEQPENEELLLEEIQKLDELTESKLDEIERNKVRIVELEIEATDVTKVKADDFNSQSAKDVLSDKESELTEIRELDLELSELNAQLSTSSSEKEEAKITKQIIKATAAKAELENDVIIALASPNREEVAEKKDEMRMDMDIAQSVVSEQDGDLMDANRLMIEANIKMDEAQKSRQIAETTKDPIEKNTLLREAFKNEKEAKELIVKAERIYKVAYVIDSYKTKEEVLIEVPENEFDRTSTKLFDQADNLRQKASENTDRAAALRDSSETVKKKDRELVLQKAEEFESKAKILDDMAMDRIDAGEEAQAKEEAAIELMKEDVVAVNIDFETSKTISSSEEYKAFYDNESLIDEKFAEAKELDNQLEKLENKKTRIIKTALVRYQTSPEEVLEGNEELAATQSEIEALTTAKKEVKSQILAAKEKSNDMMASSNEADKNKMLSMASQGVKPIEKEVVIPDDLAINTNAPQAANTNADEANNTNTIQEAEANVDEANNTNAELAADTNTDEANNVDSEPVADTDPVIDEVEDPVNNENDIAEKQASDFNVPDNVEKDIFRTTTAPIYSNSNPIPISEKQPVGLVYKVQVGAFRNPLPQDHFKEFAPISGQKLNNGITRYMVGYFKTLAPASSARRQINALGYTDAFVVAYCNGNRISIAEANKIESGEVECLSQPATESIAATVPDNTERTETVPTETVETRTNTEVANNNQETNTTRNIENQTEAIETPVVETTTVVTNEKPVQSIEISNQPVNSEERELVAYYTNTPRAAKANQVEIIKGLFYTVQIGVYSKPVPVENLFNIQPLNSQLTASNVIRYSTGIYKTVEEAVARKNEVIRIGIPDAFVTAYYNGRRITIDEANEILVQKGASAYVDGKSADLIAEEPIIIESNEDISYFKEGLYYKVLIGRYADAIPGEYATLLLQGKGILETEVDIEGRTVLVSKKQTNFAEAIETAKEFREMGVEDMDIITFYKYDPIRKDDGDKIMNGTMVGELETYDDLIGISANKFIYSKEKIAFQIVVGEFEDNADAKFLELVAANASEDIEENILNDGTTQYLIKGIKTYEDAEATKSRLIGSGFERAVIEASHDGRKLSVEKAREVIKD